MPYKVVTKTVASGQTLYNMGLHCKLRHICPSIYGFLPEDTMVEGLEWLRYGAESRCKVTGLRLGFAMQRLENSVNPAVNGYLFRIWEG